MYISRDQKWALHIALDALEACPNDENGVIASEIIISMLDKADRQHPVKSVSKLFSQDVEDES